MAKPRVIIIQPEPSMVSLINEALKGGLVQEQDFKIVRNSEEVDDLLDPDTKQLLITGISLGGGALFSGVSFTLQTVLARVRGKNPNLLVAFCSIAKLPEGCKFDQVIEKQVGEAPNTLVTAVKAFLES